MRVVLIAPFYSRDAAGESWSTYKWVQGISERCDATVLTTHQTGWHPDHSPVSAREVVNWPDVKPPNRLRRLNWELKPSYVLFYSRARRWLKHAIERGDKIDLVHQINPLALRYPCPARGLGVPYIIGPLAGSLPTPKGFKSQGTDRQWFRKLRHLDQLRLRIDPWLRGSYSGANVVLGVAPYVRDLLRHIPLHRFEVMAETGIEQVAASPKSAPSPGRPLRLLYAGRIIRTKGVLDAIRAVAIAAKKCHVELDVLGDGDSLADCRLLAQDLGIGDRVRFHGRRPRCEVFARCDEADVFFFPSFREPSGNVVFEAMSRGLPVITSTKGGPAHVVTENCGIRVEPSNPEQYSKALADAIASFSQNPEQLPKMSAAALQRIESLAMWGKKIDRLMDTYRGALPKHLVGTEALPVPGPATIEV
ncbi:MAG TPA: glycosyltransferase family 4 protein [Verrucomicrobiae bacterium]|nr:glycosyltransferase family 4 protein [Verrucomicrobiae bacterium]